MAREMVDWAAAVRIGSRLSGTAPAMKPDEAAAVVAELREGARRSTGYVRDFTGLHAADHSAPVLVVDRPRWIEANAESFADILTPVIERLTEKKGPPSAFTAAVGSKVTGAELGVVLGFLSSKVLGQFDPFSEPDGRLLLVAPNIVHVERELDVDTHDFRLWVCLHEETHRVQFTAVPWMRGYVRSQIAALTETMDPTSLLEDLPQRLSEAVRGEGTSVADLLRTPAQREAVDRITGFMSLLEGHADVVMDGVGPEVIGSVKHIRRKFTARRDGVGVLDKLLRRVLGLDAKMAQYRDGAKFVRAVVRKTSMEEFNAVFAGPDNLPSKAEIHDPDAWVGRVLA